MTTVSLPEGVPLAKAICTIDAKLTTGNLLEETLDIHF